MAEEQKSSKKKKNLWRRLIHSEIARNPVRVFMGDDPISNIFSPRHPNPDMREGLFVDTMSAQQIRDLETSYNRGNDLMINWGETNKAQKPESFSFDPGAITEASVDESGNPDPGMPATKRIACFQCGSTDNPKHFVPKVVTVVNAETGEKITKGVNVHKNPCTDFNAEQSEFGARIVD